MPERLNWLCTGTSLVLTTPRPEVPKTVSGFIVLTTGSAIFEVTVGTSFLRRRPNRK